MLTPLVKVGNASWSSAICSTVIPAAIQAATVCTVSAEYSPSTCAPRMVWVRRSAISLQKPSDRPSAGIGSADDGDLVGEGGQGGNVLVGERELSAGDRETADVAADGHDDVVGRPAAPVAGGQSRGRRSRPG